MNSNMTEKVHRPSASTCDPVAYVGEGKREGEAFQSASAVLLKAICPEDDGDDNDDDQLLTSRTSLTLSDSWDALHTTSPDLAAGGVDVPPLLQPLFGLDFLPFSPTIPEGDVPRSVEISGSAASPPLNSPEPEPQPTGKDYDEIGVTPMRERAPETDTEELQELLRTRSNKKKKPGARLKAAARSVLQRVKIAKRTSINSKATSVTKTDRSDPMENKNLMSSATATTTNGKYSPDSCVAVSKGATTTEGMPQWRTEALRENAVNQERNIQETHSDIKKLQIQLAAKLSEYQLQLEELQATQQLLARLAREIAPHQETDQEQRRVLKRSESGSFIRVHDLGLTMSSSSSEGSESASISSLSQSARQVLLRTCASGSAAPEILLMDQHLLEILDQLTDVGFSLAADEGSRFTPTRDTARLLKQVPSPAANSDASWPIYPWTHAWEDHVLVWTGRVSHEGFGHTWPVVRGRAILNTSALNVLEYLWDSKLVPKYNSMCEGRLDVYTLQDDPHVTAEESPYGFSGCAKIVQSVNRHRLLPKPIEMKSLLYARPLEQHSGSYILLSRSVWENDSATLDSKSAKAAIRTEMLLGCTIIRALENDRCEMTQMTHVHSPCVPEVLAKRAAPNQCWTLMKALQSLFTPPQPGHK